MMLLMALFEWRFEALEPEVFEQRVCRRGEKARKTAASVSLEFDETKAKYQCVIEQHYG